MTNDDDDYQESKMEGRKSVSNTHYLPLILILMKIQLILHSVFHIPPFGNLQQTSSTYATPSSHLVQ
jgi:hypothetical protein